MRTRRVETDMGLRESDDPDYKDAEAYLNVLTRLREHFGLTIQVAEDAGAERAHQRVLLTNDWEKQFYFDWSNTEQRFVITRTGTYEEPASDLTEKPCPKRGRSAMKYNTGCQCGGGEGCPEQAIGRMLAIPEEHFDGEVLSEADEKFRVFNAEFQRMGQKHGFDRIGLCMSLAAQIAYGEAGVDELFDYLRIEHETVTSNDGA